MDDECSRGCLNLIRRNEAAILSSPQDLVENLGWMAEEKPPREVQIQLSIDLSTDEAAIISALGTGKMAVDSISLKTGKPVSQIFALLTALELRGLLRSLPGRQYELV